MAGNASTYVQSARLNWVKGTTYPTAPANLYIALFTVAPTNAGTGGTEVSGGSYARVAIASAGWSAISGGSPSTISNSGAASFVTATANWGTVVAFALYDAATAGNMIVTAALTTNQTINTGATASFAAGSLVLNED